MEDRCIEGLERLPDVVRGCVLTVGNFDGVHLGHQRILTAARSLADAEGMAAVAMTFDPPPDLVLRPRDPPQRITPALQKARLLLKAGADYAVTARADPALLSLSPGQFVGEILVSRFAPRHMVEGNDFYYGRRRAGNIEMLRQAGAEHGFAVHVVDSVVCDVGDGPVHVSSSLIRRLLLAGRVEQAADCLGRPFELYGSVIRGLGRGRQLGCPTANLDAGQQVVPADGVYAGMATVGGRDFPAAVSIGDQPTFSDGYRAVEALLLDAGGEYYDEQMALRFVRRLRDQVSFPSAEALRAQIDKDVQSVRQIVSGE